MASVNCNGKLDKRARQTMVPYSCVRAPFFIACSRVQPLSNGPPCECTDPTDWGSGRIFEWIPSVQRNYVVDRDIPYKIGGVVKGQIWVCNSYVPWEAVITVIPSASKATWWSGIMIVIVSKEKGFVIRAENRETRCNTTYYNTIYDIKTVPNDFYFN